MQRLNVSDYYELGKETASIVARLAGITDDVEASQISWPLFMFRWTLQTLLTQPCKLLPASQRAIRTIAKEINQVVPEDLQTAFDPERGKGIVHSWQLNSIRSAISSSKLF